MAGHALRRLEAVRPDLRAGPLVGGRSSMGTLIERSSSMKVDEPTVLYHPCLRLYAIYKVLAFTLPQANHTRKRNRNF